MLDKIKTSNIEMLAKESGFVHPVLKTLALEGEGW